MTDETKQHWFWSPVFACRRVYLQVIAASVLINIFALASSLYIMTVYDRVIPNNAIESLWGLTIIMVVIMAFDLTVKIIRGSFVDTAGARIDRVVSDALFQRISRFDIGLNRETTGKLNTTVREFEILKDLIGSGSGIVFADLPFIFLFLIVIWGIGGPIAAVPAMIVPAVILVGVFVQPFMRRFAKLGLQQGQGKQSVMLEMLNGMETLKTIPGVSILRRRWLRSVINQSEATHKMRFSGQFTQYVTQLGQQVSQVGIVIYGVFLISSGTLSMGELIACVILSGRTLAPLGQVTQLLAKFNQGLEAYRHLDDLLAGESLEDKGKKRVSRARLSGEIKISDMSFTYEGQQQPALMNIDLEIKEKEKIAILGPIGSGKTTLLRLIAGLYEPDKGNVLFDGADVRQIRPEDMRRDVSFVFQQPVLFSGTIRENLLMGKADASDADLLEAAKLSGVDQFIGMLPNGFDFHLSEGGRELSGGMRQSIALARALIAKPAVLLMDEPTGAMDARTEAFLVKQLANAITDMTVIFVTHRGIMQNLADRLIVIEQGEITLNDTRKNIATAQKEKAQKEKVLQEQKAQSS